MIVESVSPLYGGNARPQFRLLHICSDIIHAIGEERAVNSCEAAVYVVNLRDRDGHFLDHAHQTEYLCHVRELHVANGTRPAVADRVLRGR